MVGYRWYHEHQVTPAFCFGAGMGYTAFSYANLKTSETGGNVTVSVDLTNSGSTAGAEVAQLYMSYPNSASIGEPVRQLRGFEKVQLAAGAKATVSFSITSRDRSIWDVASHSWKEQSGSFEIYVGASSCDLRVNGTFAA